MCCVKEQKKRWFEVWLQKNILIIWKGTLTCAIPNKNLCSCKINVTTVNINKEITLSPYNLQSNVDMNTTHVITFHRLLIQKHLMEISFFTLAPFTASFFRQVHCVKVYKNMFDSFNKNVYWCSQITNFNPKEKLRRV